MKYWILTILLIATSLDSLEAQSDFSEYLELMKTKKVASLRVDLNEDGELDNIYFKFPATSKHPEFGYSDPGVAHILEIALTNGDQFVLDESVDSLATPILKKGQNRIESDLIFLTEPINGCNYLLISGPEYGCCNSKLFILKISGNRVEKIYDQEFGLDSFSYDSKEEKYLFVGSTFLGETWGGFKTDFMFQSFNYPKVYSLNSMFEYDLEATKKHNRELINKYGNFTSLSKPTLIINKQTNDKKLVSLTEEVELLYQLKYDDLSRSKLSPKYFMRFDKSELRLMRNEIFASYGYIFKSQDLYEYFSSTKWYNPRFKNVDNKLTDIEKYNIQLILEAEKAP